MKKKSKRTPPRRYKKSVEDLRLDDQTIEKISAYHHLLEHVLEPRSLKSVKLNLDPDVTYWISRVCEGLAVTDSAVVGALLQLTLQRLGN